MFTISLVGFLTGVVTFGLIFGVYRFIWRYVIVSQKKISSAEYEKDLKAIKDNINKMETRISEAFTHLYDLQKLCDQNPLEKELECLLANYNAKTKPRPDSPPSSQPDKFFDVYKYKYKLNEQVLAYKRIMELSDKVPSYLADITDDRADKNTSPFISKTVVQQEDEDSDMDNIVIDNKSISDLIDTVL